MKKISGLILVLFLLFGVASTAFAAGQGNLSFNPYKVYYDGDDLIIKAVLSNTGNMTLQNVSSFKLDVFDSTGSKIASTTFTNDEWLSGLYLEPGDSKYWSVRISGADKGDLSSYDTKYSTHFENVGDVWFSSGIFIVINNKSLQTDVSPFIENGATFVPLRAIFERLGADVKWDDNTQTVTATRGNDTIKLTIGNKYLTVNGDKVTFDAPARIVDGSTMVPLRAISESFGGTVAYGKTGSAVTISIRID